MNLKDEKILNLENQIQKLEEENFQLRKKLSKVRPADRALSQKGAGSPRTMKAMLNRLNAKKTVKADQRVRG